MVYATLGLGHQEDAFHQISRNSFRAVWKYIADKRDFPIRDDF